MSADHRQAITDLDTVLGTMANQAQENFPEMEGEYYDPVGHIADEEARDAEPYQPASDDEAPEEWVPTEAEKDAALRIQALREPAAAKSVKRPRSPRVVEDDIPDLAEIFDNYDTPHATRISVCRAYASYIASLQPKKPKKAAPKKK